MQGYTLRSETYNPWGAPPQYQADSGVPGMTVALPVAVPFQPQVGSGFNSYLFNCCRLYSVNALSKKGWNKLTEDIIFIIPVNLSTNVNDIFISALKGTNHS